ncbi:hypothetical protein [Bacillus cereus]|uniref:hypothetical protein n=1 Tax=Bacillus cereus TaxID=1396 RepID=UPI001155F704|nr:hypothetical protein [Bacillus cereus]
MKKSLRTPSTTRMVLSPALLCSLPLPHYSLAIKATKRKRRRKKKKQLINHKKSIPQGLLFFTSIFDLRTDYFRSLLQLDQNPIQFMENCFHHI